MIFKEVVISRSRRISFLFQWATSRPRKAWGSIKWGSSNTSSNPESSVYLYLPSTMDLFSISTLYFLSHRLINREISFIFKRTKKKVKVLLFMEARSKLQNKNELAVVHVLLSSSPPPKTFRDCPSRLLKWGLDAVTLSSPWGALLLHTHPGAVFPSYIRECPFLISLSIVYLYNMCHCRFKSWKGRQIESWNLKSSTRVRIQ